MVEVVWVVQMDLPRRDRAGDHFIEALSVQSVSAVGLGYEETLTVTFTLPLLTAFFRPSP
jgi:hypothetical protein